MQISLEEFNKELFQDIISESEAVGSQNADIFFEKFCGFLTETGEIDTADRAYYSGPPSSGIRIDGYGGDPLDSSNTLNLIIVDFNQSAEIKRLVRSDMNKIFKRLSKFLQKSLDENWRNSLEETNPGFGLADLISKRWGSVVRVRMFLVSNRELSERVDGREADQFDERTVTYSVWDIKRLYRLAIESHGREEIEIDINNEYSGGLPLLPAHFSSANYESYLAVIPGQMLGAIYDRWGARLLEQNVRVFLQARSKVNKGIKNTLEISPSMFFAYNNGITATAESITTKERDGQQILTALKNFQIVNGGQTTASIHAAYRNNLDLSEVFVQMKLSIVDSKRTAEIVPKISEYANSQNRVSTADFFTNHPFHVRMEEFSRRINAPSPDGTFIETKWFYERARGQYQDARSKKYKSADRRQFEIRNPRSQVFSKTDLAKFLNVWFCRPHIVSLGAQKNFAYFTQYLSQTWKKSENRFNETFFKEIVSKAIIFKNTEKIVSNQPWYQGGYRANIVAYAISKSAHDVMEMKRAVDFENIWKRQALNTSMKDALAHVAEAVHVVLTNPPLGISNVTEWAKQENCWSKVKDLKIQWPKEFIDQLLTIEERNAANRSAQREQKMLNGIEAQTAVWKAGNEFWKNLINWGNEHQLLSETELKNINSATNLSKRIPSEFQAQRIFKILKKLQDEGFPGQLK